MKNHFFKLLCLSLIVFVMFTFNCQLPSSNGGGGGSKGGHDGAVEAPIDYTAMVIVSEITNFPMGYDDVAEEVHFVPLISSFKIGKYEVTYAQWYTVRQWAILPVNGYTFTNPGREGFSTNQSTPTARKFEPVTIINWRDCIVWCNAASQYEGLTPVYYKDAGFTMPLKISTDNESIDTTAGSEDNPYVNWSANGYRLPTEAEWEAAARYIDGNIWLRGDAPSGWVDNNPADGNWRIEVGGDWEEDDVEDNYSEVNAVAWWSSNSSITTHKVGTKNANNLSIYDMSGNVWEWCWDWYGTYTTSSPYTDNNPKGHVYDLGNPCRLSRGGGFYEISIYLQVSARFSALDPFVKDICLGFRVCRNN